MEAAYTVLLLQGRVVVRKEYPGQNIHVDS